MSEPTVSVPKHRSALLLVDLQPDFMPGGALAVAEGDRIVAPVSDLVHADLFGCVAATQDWHPRGHVSFASTHAGHKPFDVIPLYGREQTLWPDHCIQGTAGATLHPGVAWDAVAVIVRKGMEPDCDSYSGFRNNWNPQGRRPATGLAGYLKERGIGVVFCCGLARDVCVKWTAEDAADSGFETYFVWDLTRAVDPASDERVRAELAKRDVRVVTSAQLQGA